MTHRTYSLSPVSCDCINWHGKRCAACLARHERAAREVRRWLRDGHPPFPKPAVAVNKESPDLG